MSPTAVPTRITIDFRDSIHPSRTWILGLDQSSERADLLSFELPVTPRLDPPVRIRRRPAAVLIADCTCPEYCERDHANE
jgi:hypothetical protein